MATVIPNATTYVHNQGGDLPIVLTAPHGGLEQPPHIADRTSGCLEHDHDTLDLARRMADAIQTITGKQCALVALLLHRVKLDANRPCATAAEDQAACDVWNVYHGAIESHITAAVKKFGFCHVWDIHGQSHRADASELGYRIFKADLNMSDEELNADPTIARSCSLAHLLLLQQEKAKKRQRQGDKCSPVTLAGLTRGARSFGAVLTNNGYPCTPSPSMPYPGDELDFFSGAYTTVFHGCCGEEGRTPRTVYAACSRNGAAAACCKTDTTDTCRAAGGVVSEGKTGNAEGKEKEKEEEEEECVGLQFTCACDYGAVSVTQIESQSQPRLEEAPRRAFAEALARSVVDFIQTNYEVDLC